MAGYSDKETEKRLARLEAKISKEYADALKEAEKSAEAYSLAYEERYKKEEVYLMASTLPEDKFKDWFIKERSASVSDAELNAIYNRHKGVYTEAQFKAWQQAQLGRGKRWEQMKEDIANRITHANEVASSYINDATPGIYSLNHNYEAYRIDTWDLDINGSERAGISFNIYNEQAVKVLIENGDLVVPRVSVDPEIDIPYNIKKVQSAVTSNIITGKGVYALAEALESVYGSNRASAMRNARTAVTSAMNYGRDMAQRQAQNMGIELECAWYCTHDERTRFSHAMMDHERRKVGEAFSNGLMYPGDSEHGTIKDWINCRCVKESILPGLNDDGDIEAFNEWMEQQEDFKPEYWTKQQKKTAGLKTGE